MKHINILSECDKNKISNHDLTSQFHAERCHLQSSRAHILCVCVLVLFQLMIAFETIIGFTGDLNWWKKRHAHKQIHARIEKKVKRPSNDPIAFTSEKSIDVFICQRFLFYLITLQSK